MRKKRNGMHYLRWWRAPEAHSIPTHLFKCWALPRWSNFYSWLPPGVQQVWTKAAIDADATTELMCAVVDEKVDKRSWIVGRDLTTRLKHFCIVSFKLSFCVGGNVMTQIHSQCGWFFRYRDTYGYDRCNSSVETERIVTTHQKPSHHLISNMAKGGLR